MTKTTRLSRQGQITLPKQLIKKLDLKYGQLIDLEQKGDTIIIYKKQNTLDEFVGLLKDKVDITLEEYLDTRKKESL